MKNICVVTGTRAEFGLLKPLLKGLAAEDFCAERLVVTGMHLCPEFGLTYREIEDEGFTIDEKLEVMLSSDTSIGTTKSVGLAMISFAEYFERKRPDLLIVLGDRFEIFACASAAALMQIPIAHLYGGDTTEGATDEFMRHSITKMSYLHFASTEMSKKRVEQLGESPDRVFNVGALSVENILNVPFLAKADLESSIQWELKKNYALVTFHPVTLECNSTSIQFKQLLDALDCFKDMQFLFTKANADSNGRIINTMIEQYVVERDNCLAVTSLGQVRYLSAMRYASMVIGNSSSGLYEAPSFHIPTINIGDRQKGRLQPISVINCTPTIDGIVSAIKQGLSGNFLQECKKVGNPYGNGNTSQKIIDIIKDFLQNNKIYIKKEFYDIGETME